MRELFSKYGIEFIEIKRKAVGSMPISASVVRKKLAENDWNAVRQLVPDTTYAFLKKNMIF